MDIETFKENQEKRQARMEQLYQKPVGELVRMIIALEEENEKTKDYRRRLLQIRNICLDPSERSRPGRPKKESGENPE